MRKAKGTELCLTFGGVLETKIGDGSKQFRLEEEIPTRRKTIGTIEKRGGRTMVGKYRSWSAVYT